MSEDDKNCLAAIAVQMRMVVKRLDEIRSDNQYCRTHCDSAMSGTFKRLSEMEKTVHGLVGAKVNPHWVLVMAEWAGIGILIYYGLHK